MLIGGLRVYGSTMTKPSKFTQALADHICNRITSGESLRAICNEDGMPCVGTVHTWRRDNADFNEKYRKAREFQAETLFDEMLEIADTPKEGIRTKDGPNGVEVVRTDMLGHRELQIKTRQWILPRLNKNMTDKAQLDHTSSDGSMSTLSDEAKAARLTAIHKEAKAKLSRAKKVEDDGSDLV